MKDNKGSVVLYAVFLMMALSATAMITAFVVLNTTRYTGNSTRVASAFYAAESGIEQGLYEIKQHRDDRTTINEALDASTIADTTLDNGAIYSTVAVNDYKTEISFDIPLYESKQIDFFDPDSGDALISSTGTINIIWHRVTGCTSAADLELSIRSFTSSTWDDVLGTGEGVNVLACADSCTNTAYPLQASYGHKIKLKPLYCDLEITEFYITDEDGRVAFPNYIKITSTGEMGVSSFPMQAETIWKPPLSGLGEFVLFSEMEITK